MDKSLPRSSTAERQPVKLDVGGAEPPVAAKKRYESQLGMSLNAASHRLKKSVYLDLLVRLGEADCYRCGQPITDPSDLSLDHKDPWRNESADLFWDLDNIAHSHRKCNTADRPTRKEGPPDTSWCFKCKAFLPISAFGKGPRWNGLNAECLECGRQRTERYARRNPRFPCPKCRCQMRKKCSRCGHALTMAEYMALRRREGVQY